jgi:hypothetical protein
MSGGARVTALTALLVAGAAQAGQLVCKDKIIEVGTTAAQLLAACGEPVAKQAQTATLRDPGARGGGDVHQSEVETWRYERHSRRLTTFVTLRDGKVAAVKNK